MRRYEKCLVEKIEQLGMSCECCGAFGYQPNCSGCNIGHELWETENKLAKLRGFDDIHDMGDFESYLAYKLGIIPFNQSYFSDKWELLLSR